MSAPSNYVTFNENKATIEEKIRSTPGLVIVDFTAPWCPDCRRLAAGLPKVAAANPDVLFLVCDVDKVQGARDDWQIAHIPDVRFYKGEPTHLHSIVEGSAQQVQAKIEELK
ncbi:Thioredoxin H-type [Tritrichomonas foetus]|uniref:Thioredoxin H-type n=1 Tax=Tritrichomonas foetus TaxID=1144522 RepID=A0A1J4K0M7_9EUKA|nr:Thioredoxin H-type [Tritrichomonas foetus]|eukprot:OHT04514.1 Thioredoxin H-type [Tritrichomonas foetus]